MPLKVTAFRHPEHNALCQRNQTLALWWGVAHVFFILFAILAMAMPLVLVLLALISPDIPKERLLSIGISFSAACLIISALGFGLRCQISKRGRSLDDK